MISATIETKFALKSAVSADQVAIGPRMAQYQLHEVVGQGGMGVVYRAIDASGDTFALKVIRSEWAADPRTVRRFQTESEILGRLRHSNIVRLVDRGQSASGAHYFAMEFAAGVNLNDAVQQSGPLSSQLVVRTLRNICAALTEVHHLGVVHGDIKPANVIAFERNGVRTIKLVDFGLARFVAAREHEEMFAADCFAGSPWYASPECNAGEVDCRSDIYSLGAVAFYLLTGRPVFEETRPVAAIVAHADHAPRSPRCVRANVDPLLDSIVLKCLSKNPRERFQSVAELDAALSKAV